MTKHGKSISRAISHLLYQHKKLCIPGLGRFEVDLTDTSIHPVSHNFAPPAGILRFDASDTGSDGLLENFLAKAKNISITEARKEIDDFVESIKRDIDQEGQSSFSELGVFSRGVHGEITFKQDNSSNFDKESYGLGEFTSMPIQRTAPVQASTPVNAEPEKSPSKEQQKSETTEKSTDSKTAPTKETAEPTAADTQKTTAAEEKPVRRLGWVWFIIALLGIAFITWFWWPEWQTAWYTYHNSRIERTTPRSVSGDDEELNARKMEDETIEEAYPETTNTEFVDPEPVVTEAEPIPTDNEVAETETFKYYIIAGCFRSQKNADRLLNDLKAQGYPASIQGKTPKGLHRVCYMGFSDFKSARKELQRILKEENSAAWLINLEKE